MKTTLDDLQKEYDNQLSDETCYCLRCDEEMDNCFNDLCEYCEEIITEQNKSRFIEQETR